MTDLIKKVEEWSRVRRLDTADPKAQTLKVIEEFTEMLMAFEEFKKQGKVDLSHEWDEVVDGVGDTYVTLIILCQQLKIDFKNTVKGCITRNTDNSMYPMNKLATGISKGQNKAIRNGIIGLTEITKYIALNINYDVLSCLSIAYDEIKDRKGMMIHGSFVKYDDLSPVNKAVLDNA